MSQQGKHSELEDYPRSQRIFPGWRTVWIVVGFLVVLAAGILYLGREVARIHLTIWAKSTGKSVAKATYLYASDNDDVLPLAPNWESTIDKYWKEEREVETNAWSWNGRKTRFAMNGKLSGVSMKTIKDPSVVPLFFLATLPGPSAVGGTQDVAYNEQGYAIVSFTDTTVRTIKKEDVERLQWTVPGKSPAK